MVYVALGQKSMETPGVDLTLLFCLCYVLLFVLKIGLRIG